MKKLHLITIIFLLSIISNLVETISIHANNTNSDNCLMIGDYLPIEYVKTIKDFNSPLSASKGLTYSLGRIEKSGDKYRISIGGHFDAVSLYISSDCKTSIENTIGITAFKLIDNENFSFEESGKTIIFHYVGIAYSKWIAKTLFEGNWKDQAENEFSFLSDNTVIIDGEKFNYDISFTDPVDFDGLLEDIIMIGTDQYVFKLKENMVELYELHPPTIAKEPKYKIKRH